MKSDYESVNDQSGIFAGKGGYDITVGNNTDLKGAVIASEAQDISKNKLDTGTISFSDIENKANFKVSHISVSGGTGGASAPTAYQNSDKASSTTKSAVEKGQLIVRNQEEQQQDINKLSRDTASANDPLKQIFDKDKELDKIETVELVKDIAQQAKNVVNKYDRIQAQNDVDKNKDKLSKAEAEKAYEKLTEEEKSQITLDEYYKGNEDYWYYAAVDTQLKTNQEKNKNLGTMGGNVSKGIDTATSIVMGIINGDITGGLAGASAPWIAEQIKLHTGHKDEKGEWKVDDPAANYIAHAILGAVVAELQGNSGLAGGAGAVGGEIAADIIRKAIYAGKDAKDLTEAEKQNISALAQLAAGLATAAGSGDVGDVGTAISSSKNAVENNYLTEKDIEEADKKYAACKGDKDCQMQVVKETNELSKQKDREWQETLLQIQNEMAVQMREAVQYCEQYGKAAMQCQKTEYDQIIQEARDKYDAYKKMALDGTDRDKVQSQYYPDDTKIQALWEGIKNAPGKLVDGIIEGGDKTIRYIDDNSLGKIGDDAWEFGKKIASIPAEWLNKEIPADSFETALTNLGSMTGHDVGEAIFFESAGYATTVLGGKAIQWIGGKWVPVKPSAPLAVGEKVIIGPWSKDVTNIVKGKTFTQCSGGSCVSATGQLLTNGLISEKKFLELLGEWSHPEALAGALNKTTNTNKWIGGYFHSAEDALKMVERGRMGVILQAKGSPAHMVTIEPISRSKGKFRVYDTGAGATYDVTSDWVKTYVSGGVWKK